MILCGHPGGNPNSHNAALAHFEHDRLEAFVVPWMPSTNALKLLSAIPLLRTKAARLSRRHFPPLAGAPKIQGRLGELRRLMIRSRERGDEGLSYEANDWLMRTMARACKRKSVTAVHSFEDCSLLQFEKARQMHKSCIYDMPIGFYPAWQDTEQKLAREYSEWLPDGGLPSNRWVRPGQKRQEMELADLVLAPSTFVEKTIREFFPQKRIALAPYGVDAEFWQPASRAAILNTPLRFIYAGQCSVRKGIPLLLDAWRNAGLADAELELVGIWQLSEAKRKALPAGVRHLPPCSRHELLQRYQSADVFVFPSFFEGFGLVLLEAMACGLPAIASTSTAGPDCITEQCGRVIETGNMEQLIDSFRWFASHRDDLSTMKLAARSQAERCTWENYRRRVSGAVTAVL